MEKNRLFAQLPVGLGLLLCCTLLSISTLCCLALQTLQAVLDGQQSHAESFVPAKRIAADFERQILNARIFFIYYVTIQKPESYEKGWARYQKAETRLDEMSSQVASHPELADLVVPVARLRDDLAAYRLALNQTLEMVGRGELRGPHFEAQVKEWAARGAILVTDAGNVEQLCSSTSEASTDRIVDTLKASQFRLLCLLAANCLMCAAATLLLGVRLRRLLREMKPLPGMAGGQELVPNSR